MPKMTAVVPCYNEEERITKLLDNLQKQALMPEIIIVDGGSTDKTVALIKERMKKNKSIRLMREAGKNRSPANARNIGWNAAKGDIIYLMDTDSQIEEDFTKKIVKEFKKNPGVDAIKFICHPYIPKKFSNTFEKALYYKDERGDGRLIIFAKKAIDKLGYFDASLGFGEDKVWGKGWSKLNMIETKTVLTQSKSGYLNFKKFFQRYLWYGRTIPKYLQRNNDNKTLLQAVLATIFVVTVLTFWVHPYLAYLALLMLLLPIVRGIAFGVRLYRLYGVKSPTAVLPLTEILGFFLVGMGVFKYLLGDKTVGR